MKNCLIIGVALFGCFALAAFLVFATCTNFGRGFKSEMVATWIDYDDPGRTHLEVSIGPNVIFLVVPFKQSFKRIQTSGHWNMHAFYCDSHLDAPAEMVVARELKNEDLELDLGYFMPSRPGKILCVKTSRFNGPYPYPTYVSGQHVSYPPPKGLIRPGMLKCDLEMLPWRADRIELTPTVVQVDTSTLSDGKENRSYFSSSNVHDGEDASAVYTYHSERSDVPKLLVTVYHGKVVQVVGGAEDTTDIPYTLPTAPLRSDLLPQDSPSFAGGLFDWFFKK